MNIDQQYLYSYFIGYHLCSSPDISCSKEVPTKPKLSPNNFRQKIKYLNKELPCRNLTKQRNTLTFDDDRYSLYIKNQISELPSSSLCLRNRHLRRCYFVPRMYFTLSKKHFQESLDPIRLRMVQNVTWKTWTMSKSDAFSLTYTLYTYNLRYK